MTRHSSADSGPLADLRALSERATAGAWQAKHYPDYGNASIVTDCYDRPVIASILASGRGMAHKDAELIVAAVNALPDLLTTIETLRARNTELEAALEPFAKAADTASANHKTAFVFVADLRRARAAISSGGSVMRFVLKAFRVSVLGLDSWTYYAKSRASALSKAYGDWRSLRDEGDFKTFLKIARCSSDGASFPSRFGDPITVNGKPAFFIENNRQYVRIAWPDSDIISNAHPLEVKPIEYRPDTYRSEKFDAQ